MAIAVEIDALAPTTGARVTLRFVDADDERLTRLNGKAWWPGVVSAPTLDMDGWDGNFSEAAKLAGAAFALDPYALRRADPLSPSYRWAGAPVRVYEGDPTQPFAAWRPRFYGLISDYGTNEAGTYSMSAQVDGEPFEAQVLSLTYAGTGGAEGGEDLKGKPKPMCFGIAQNVEPVQIDAVNNVYQVHGYGSIQAILHVYERAADLVASGGVAVGDFATYDALVAATIPEGDYGTCLTHGMFRLGAPPAGLITADVAGDNVGSFSRTTAAVISKACAIASVDATRVDQASLAALEAAVPFPINVYLTSAVKLIDLVQSLVRPCNAQAVITWTGQLRVIRFGAIPAPTITLDAQGRALPAVMASMEQRTSPPYWRIEMRGARVWRPQTKDEIAYAVVPVERGTYDAARTYAEGDVVSLADGSRWEYIAFAASAGNAPMEGDYWTRLAPPTEADWDLVTGDTKPEDNATVGATIGGNLKDAAGNVVTGPQILNSALSLAPDGTLSVDLGNGPVPLGKVKLADIGGATETDRRRLTADLERIAAAVATLGAGQQTVMNVFRDAGMYADPASGQIKLFAIEQRAEQIAKLSVSLDAALGQIGLKASVDYVNQAITQAQLPGQAAALDSIYVRLTSAEANIDGLRASVQLKADATIVTGLSGTVTAVQQSLDALTATVATKASQTQVDQQGVRLTFAEQTLSALDGASITQSVSASRRIPADSDKAGEASILDMLNGARNLDAYQVGIALARTELGARVTDANNAIASLATQLAVQIGAVTAQYASEVAARIIGDQATVSDLTAFKAQTGANVASINQALVAQSDAASSNARAITSVSSRVADTETSVSFLLSAANGNEAVAQLAVTAGGVVTGFRVNGQTRAFIIQANAFAIEGRQVFTYNSDTGVLMAPELVVQRLTVSSVGFDQLQLGSAGQTLSYELQNDVTIAKGGSTEVMWINITKLDADSEIEVQWSADVSSQDDVQFTLSFQVDGATSKTRVLNEKYAKANARTSTSPTVRLKGVAAGARRIGVTFHNDETDNASMTVYAGALLKVTELRKALLGVATGGEASGSSGSAGTGSGSGGGGTYNGGVAKFQTEQ